MDKKADYRFNIYLNPSDPMHMTAIKALNAQGRHKAQFIVNAIVHYVMDDRSQMKAIMLDMVMPSIQNLENHFRHFSLRAVREIFCQSLQRDVQCFWRCLRFTLRIGFFDGMGYIHFDLTL